MVRRKGTVGLVGLPPGEFPTPIFDVVLKRITLRGSIVGTRRDLDEAIAFATEGKVKAEITKAPLERHQCDFCQAEGGQSRGPDGAGPDATGVNAGALGRACSSEFLRLSDGNARRRGLAAPQCCGRRRCRGSAAALPPLACGP